MGRATQPRRVNRYTLEFKLSAVQMSKLRGVQIQEVAQALDIHPFMLSRWRKQVFIFMNKLSLDATEFFSIPPNRVVEVGGQIEI